MRSRSYCPRRFRLKGILGRAALCGMIVSTSFHSCSAFWKEPYKTYVMAAGIVVGVGVSVTEGVLLVKSHNKLAEKDDEIKRLQSCANKNDETSVQGGAGSTNVDSGELQDLRQTKDSLNKKVLDLTSENKKLSEQLSKQGGSNEQTLYRRIGELEAQVRNLSTENTNLQSELANQKNEKEKKGNDGRGAPLSSTGKLKSLDDVDV